MSLPPPPPPTTTPDKWCAIGISGMMTNIHQMHCMPWKNEKHPSEPTRRESPLAMHDENAKYDNHIT